MKPAARRDAVGYLMERRSYSQRRACRVVGLSRSVAQYRPTPKQDEVLRVRMRIWRRAIGAMANCACMYCWPVRAWW